MKKKNYDEDRIPEIPSFTMDEGDAYLNPNYDIIPHDFDIIDERDEVMTDIIELIRDVERELDALNGIFETNEYVLEHMDDFAVIKKNVKHLCGLVEKIWD